MYDDVDRETPPAVVAAVAAGCAPLPFLAVYSTIFLVHGSLHPVIPPDVTGSKEGEFAVGAVCALVLVLVITSLLWLLNARRRWPFVILQLGILGTAIDFLIDVTKGGRAISTLVVITTVVALVCALLPQTWEHMGRRTPRLVTRLVGLLPARLGGRGEVPASASDSAH